MKITSGSRSLIVFAAVLFFARAASAQDADKQKMIDMEKAFAAQTAPGPEMAAVSKQVLYEGTLIQLTAIGQVGALPKSKVVELTGVANPADPDVKSATTISDFRVEIYGDTALVAYKLKNTDTGHKDPALNATDHFACLDTFVKRSGQWSMIGSACSLSEPMSHAEWLAQKKAMSQMPKDVKDAYH
jgi:hypothetical protein